MAILLIATGKLGKEEKGRVISIEGNDHEISPLEEGLFRTVKVEGTVQEYLYLLEVAAKRVPRSITRIRRRARRRAVDLEYKYRITEENKEVARYGF